MNIAKPYRSGYKTVSNKKQIPKRHKFGVFKRQTTYQSRERSLKGKKMPKARESQPRVDTNHESMKSLIDDIIPSNENVDGDGKTIPYEPNPSTFQAKDKSDHESDESLVDKVEEVKQSEPQEESKHETESHQDEVNEGKQRDLEEMKKQISFDSSL